MLNLRISALGPLSKCPGFSVLSQLRDGGSKAADTGSAVGRVCELWHRKGETALALDAAIRQAHNEAPEQFPKADFDDVRTWALGYAADGRNKGVVLAEKQEAEVKLTLGEFTLVGHVDQIRDTPEAGKRVWDIKSGKPGGRDMVVSYAWQVSAYALACTETWGEPVLPGGIIRIRAYDWNNRCKWDNSNMANAPVFYPMPWGLDACWEMMESAKKLLQMLKAGEVLCTPGTHCQWCPGLSPHLCGDKLEEAFG